MLHNNLGNVTVKKAVQDRRNVLIKEHNRTVNSGKPQGEARVAFATSVCCILKVKLSGKLSHI